MTRFFTPLRLVAAGLVLLAVAGALVFLPADAYVFLPDRARAVAPFVEVQGERRTKDGGGIYYVAVDVRKATLIERLFPGIYEGSTVVPSGDFLPPCVSEEARRRGELREMARSQREAAAVALRALGYRVRVRHTGAVVEQIAPDAPAACKLRPTDVIVEVDGQRVQTPQDLRRLIRPRRPGTRVRLRIRREDGRHDLTLRTIPDPGDPSRAIIGIRAGQAARIRLPLRVDIDLGNVGGPSAGLAFALDLMEGLGRDVDRGYKVAATGEIELDGSVGDVGGVKQKAIGARRAGVDVFLVPAVGDNAREARKYAPDLRIIPVQTFPQALRDLATLPRKSA